MYLMLLGPGFSKAIFFIQFHCLDLIGSNTKQKLSNNIKSLKWKRLDLIWSNTKQKLSNNIKSLQWKCHDLRIWESDRKHQSIKMKWTSTFSTLSSFPLVGLVLKQTEVIFSFYQFQQNHIFPISSYFVANWVCGQSFMASGKLSIWIIICLCQ